MEKPPKLSKYNYKGYLDEHVQLFNERLNYFNGDEASKCKLSAITLVGLTRLWFNTFSNKSIEYWMNFYKRFDAYFTGQKMQLVTITALSVIIHWKKESLRSYIDLFTQVEFEVDKAE